MEQIYRVTLENHWERRNGENEWIMPKYRYFATRQAAIDKATELFEFHGEVTLDALKEYKDRRVNECLMFHIWVDVLGLNKDEEYDYTETIASADVWDYYGREVNGWHLGRGLNGMPKYV